jgi:hypothetical protein
LIQIGPSAVRNVTVTVEGLKHDGTYYLQGSTLYVQSAFGTKATQLGGSTPEIIARILLSELVRAGDSAD